MHTFENVYKYIEKNHLFVIINYICVISHNLLVCDKETYIVYEVFNRLFTFDFINFT